jgi:hypothetical protein
MDFDKFLNPNAIKNNLMLSALYLAAYEILKVAIIDNIKNFFYFEYRNGKAIPSKRYKKEVIKMHKDLLYASCLWLERNEIITKSEVEEIERIRKHRNQIAHELPKLLANPDLNLNIAYFLRIRELLKKIELWWVQNVEIPTNPDFDNEDVNEGDIYPGRVVVLDHVISVALADHVQQQDSNSDPASLATSTTDSMDHRDQHRQNP